MKRIMSLSLAVILLATLLLGVIPTNALATTTGITVKVYQDVDGVEVNSDYSFNETGDTDGRATVSQVFASCGVTAENVEGIWFINPDGSEYKKNAGDSFPLNGGTLKIRLKAITTTSTEPPEPTETTTYKVTIVVKKDGVEGTPYEVAINGASTTVQNLITYKVDANAIAGMEFDTAYTNASGYMNENGTVKDGEKVYIAFKTPAAEVAPIDIVVKVESSNNVVWTGSKVPANGQNAVVEDLLTYCWNKSWDDVYYVDHVWSSEQKRTVDESDKVYAGDTVSFLLKEKNSSTSTSSSSTTTNKFPYNVYLNIYKDTLVGSPDKCINITNGIALDGLVTLSEVKTVVTSYYYADDSYGITYDGLYLAEGNWVADYLADTKYPSIYASEMQQTGYVYINVMIGNATAYSTATADTSNPKTGDDIYMAVAALGLSGAALASALYVFTKKRQVI